MAEAIVGTMLWKLQQLAVREARTLAAVDEDIRSLRDKLMWMQAFLQDVQPSRRVQPNELIKVWLQQTRDSVFDAEDAVDEYFIKIDLSRFHSCSRAIISFFASFTTQLRVRQDLSSRIKLINARLEGIIANKDRYRMGESTTLGSTWRPSSATSSLSKKTDDVVLPLVGREEQMQKLKNSLIDRHQLVIITVTGESGVGKTKLVRDFYDRRHTMSQFEIHEWVSFGLNLSATDVLKMIISRIGDGEEYSKEPIEDKLKHTFRTKKYLLVIDAELSNTEWNRIFSMLPKEVDAGSRLVRISQHKLEKPPPPYDEINIDLGKLDDETTMDLFMETLSPYNGDTDRATVVENFREKVLHSTKGLPLAVVLLSGLLRTKEYPNQWNAVFCHLGKMQSKRMDKILSLSFDDLHYDLKSCLLYFAALPMNTLVRAQNIVCMWMAEGFLIPKSTTAEKVGEQYLKELIERRLVNLAPTGYDVPGHERVAVQSTVHDFLQLEAQEQCFVQVHSGDDTPALPTVRRLSLQNHRDKYTALARPLPKLRAILSNFETEEQEAGTQAVVVVPGDGDQMDMVPGGAGDGDGDGVLGRPYPGPGPGRCCPTSFSVGDASKKKKKKKKKAKSCMQDLLHNSKFLRVIHFHGLEVDKELPAELGGLVNLQYLRVTSCSLEKVPPSIGRLSNLQTLDVRGTQVRSLPADFWQIQTLRHVLGDRLILPAKRVGRLRKLQTLNTVMPDGNGWDANTFTRMIRLWYLRISLPINQDQDLDLLCINNNKAALVKAVDLLKYLVVLIIKAPSIPSQVFTKSNLPRLKAMELVGKLVPPPDQHSTPTIRLPNLVKLRLKNTMVSQGFINLLGGLQSLSTLALRSRSYKDRQLIFKAGFHSLKELMVHAEDLDSIEIHESALPALTDMDILRRSSDFRVEIHGHHPGLVECINADEDQTLREITFIITHVPVENNGGESNA